MPSSRAAGARVPSASSFQAGWRRSDSDSATRSEATRAGCRVAASPSQCPRCCTRACRRARSPGSRGAHALYSTIYTPNPIHQQQKLQYTPKLSSRHAVRVCSPAESCRRGACHARNAFAKHMGGMERLKAAWATGKEWAGIARSNPARTMKLLSAVSGALLIVGGISGVINIFNPLGIVISIYNM